MRCALSDPTLALVLALALPAFGCGSSAAPAAGSDASTDALEDSVVDAPPSDAIFPLDETGAADADAAVEVGPVKCTESGAKTFGGHCYFRIDNNRTWAIQQAACAATGPNTHLVVITSAEEQSFVNGLLGLGADRWIGLSRALTDPPTAKASFVWITGEPATFDAWASGEPNGTGACARLSTTLMGGAIGRWGDQSCDQNFAAICEREP